MGSPKTLRTENGGLCAGWAWGPGAQEEWPPASEGGGRTTHTEVGESGQLSDMADTSSGNLFPQKTA